MSRKPSVYLSDRVEAILGPAESLSGRIGAIVSRYDEIVRRECPKLSLDEWIAVLDVMNGTAILDEASEADYTRFLWAEIADADRLNGIGAKWSIDAQALSDRIRAMRYVEQVAILEMVSRFWWAPNDQRNDPENLLREAGARIGG